jgi:hypothetical protein
MLGEHGGEAEEPCPRREREARVRRRDLDRAGDRGADHLAAALDDEGREARVVEVLLVLRAGLLEVGKRQA